MSDTNRPKTDLWRETMPIWGEVHIRLEALTANERKVLESQLATVKSVMSDRTEMVEWAFISTILYLSVKRPALTVDTAGWFTTAYPQLAAIIAREAWNAGLRYGADNTIWVNLKLKSEQFKQGMDKAISPLKAFGAAISAVGLIEFAKRIANATAEVVKLELEIDAARTKLDLMAGNSQGRQRLC